MNYFYPNGGNPNLAYATQQKMDALQQELTRLQQLQAQLYPGQMSNQNSKNSQLEGGMYLYVNNYQDVIDYPTPTDGSAVLFLCLDQGLAWSKKFVNGKSSIQALTISFLNSYDQGESQNMAKVDSQSDQVSNADIMNLLTTLADRLTVLESKVGE